MSSVLDYWGSKLEIPDSEKLRIKRMVRGKDAGHFMLSNKCHKLLRVDGDVFKSVFIVNRGFLYKGDYTAPPEENNYSDSANYLSDDGLAGFSISKEGWLVSLYSNYRTGGFAKAVKDFIVPRAYKLVCIVSRSDSRNSLVNLYKNAYGFREYARTVNDTKVMREHYGDEFINNFVQRYGIPYHVFMIGGNAAGEPGEIRSFDYYFDAEDYVERTVRQIGKKGDR